MKWITRHRVKVDRVACPWERWGQTCILDFRFFVREPLCSSWIQQFTVYSSQFLVQEFISVVLRALRGSNQQFTVYGFQS